ncbi:MAG: molybdenum cofactor guanylyltransferase [Verrucomicrobia bacterium]|nr:molybdenum cofactor guanylyltransferase [Verrucomicrobiota bacterium]
MRMPFAFSAVLLAGGASRRMGIDKALLPAPGGHARSQPLLMWQRQLQLLQALEPAEIFLSGPRRPGFPEALPCIADRLPSRGPLGGLATCLDQITTPWLLVLAIDLPFMETEFLARVLEACKTGRGAVPRSPGHYEPLAAVYPRTAASAANAALDAGQFRLQGLVERLVRASLVEPYPLRPGDLRLFRNWNTIHDLNA